MAHSFRHSSNSPSSLRLWVLVLLVLLFPAEMFALRAGAAPRPETDQPPIQAAASTSPRLAALPLADAQSSNPISWVLNNRSRMIQLATLGVCIGLFIMMRK